MGSLACHAFGSELIRRGVDISIVSRLMGHSNTTLKENANKDAILIKQRPYFLFEYPLSYK